jgi:hypothetical protein
MRVRLVDPFAAAAILNNLGFWIVVFSRYKKKHPVCIILSLIIYLNF